MLRLLNLTLLLGCAMTASSAQLPSAQEQQQAQEQARRATEQAGREADKTANADALQKSRAAMDALPAMPSPRFDLPATESLGALPGDAAAWALSEGGEAPPLLLLVSFSMPEAELRALAAQAAKLGAPLVLRGLIADSMEETAKRIAGWPKEAGMSFAIDPTLFSRFGVERVPTLILPLQALRGCTPQDCPVPEHARVSGAASLGYLLEQIERRARQPVARERAASLRLRLEKS